MSEPLGDASFGQILKRFRERRGLSRADLADAAGLDRSTISRLESGERTTTRETVEKLAVALRLAGADRGELFHAGGFLAPDELPLVVDERVSHVARLLADASVPEEAKARIRSVLEVAGAYGEATRRHTPDSR